MIQTVLLRNRARRVPLRRRARRPLALRPRSAVALLLASAVGVLAFGWPFLAATPPHASPNAAHAGDAPWIFLTVLPAVLAVVLAEFADGRLDAKAIAILGVLAGCGAALRPFGGEITGASPVFFLLMPAGRALGAGFGFCLGVLTLFASALLTGGVGPWLPFQMIAAGWVGLGAGWLPVPRRWHGRWPEIAMLAGYGACAGLAYGAVMDLWFWPLQTTGLAAGISYVPGADPLTELRHFTAFYVATSLGFDIPRAAANAVLVAVAGRPVLAALRRAARRAAFDATVSVTPLPADRPEPVTSFPGNGPEPGTPFPPDARRPAGSAPEAGRECGP